MATSPPPGFVLNRKPQISPIIPAAPAAPPAGYQRTPTGAVQIDPGYVSGQGDLAQQQAAIARQNAAYQAQLQRENAAYQAQLQRESEALKAKQTTGAKARDPIAIGNITALSQQFNDVANQYRRNFKGKGPVKSAMEYLDVPAASKFNAAAAGLSEQFMSAFRVPGMGTQSDRELAAFIDANQPSAYDTDEAVEQKLKNIERRIVARRQALGLKGYPEKGALTGAVKGMPKASPTKAKNNVIDFNDLPE